jgi:NADH dehydrogenase [ubiquinone] 1 alpha subcomplex assembly factor 7
VSTTSRGWCERLVDVDYEDGEDHFRFVLSPGATPAARVYIGREKVYDPSNASPVIINPHDPQPQQPATSAVKTPEAQVGDRIEISPVSIALAQDIARRVAEHGGGALIVDYGHDHPSQLSLRGIKDHEFVSVLREPGDVDLSIDVDFATLRRFATQESPDAVVASGPIGQGQFLRNMGIEHRLAALLQSCESDEQAQELFSSYERLVEPDQMGDIFKAMALTHASLGAPVGFEQHPQEGQEDPKSNK